MADLESQERPPFALLHRFALRVNTQVRYGSHRKPTENTPNPQPSTKRVQSAQSDHHGPRPWRRPLSLRVSMMNGFFAGLDGRHKWKTANLDVFLRKKRPQMTLHLLPHFSQLMDCGSTVHPLSSICLRLRHMGATTSAALPGDAACEAQRGGAAWRVVSEGAGCGGGVVW